MVKNTQSKTIAQCAEEGGWCEKLVEDVANYYKKIMKEAAIPCVEDFIYSLKGEGANSFYSNSYKRTVRIDELEWVLNHLKSESYGAK
jgi:hypothetical protein